MASNLEVRRFSNGAAEENKVAFGPVANSQKDGLGSGSIIRLSYLISSLHKRFAPVAVENRPEKAILGDSGWRSRQSGALQSEVLLQLQKETK